MLEKDKVKENVKTRQEKKKMVSQDLFLQFSSVGLEPPAGDVSSIADCQEWGKEVQFLLGGHFFWSRSSSSEEFQTFAMYYVPFQVQSLGADFFFFSGVTEECQMFATMQSSCSATGGPAAAPPLEECEGRLKS